MDDTITKQSLEVYEMKQMLERLVQNQTENQGNDHTDQNDNEYVVQEQHTEQQPTEQQHTEHQEETQRKHQQECGSDISIDGRDADLLMTIRDISDSLSAKIQKETDLPQMITTLPLVSQPLALCELAPLDQTVQIVNEESQLETTKKQVEIQKNDEEVTLVEKELVTVPDKDEQEKPIKKRKLCKIENKKVQDEDEQGWGDVNYVISCINIKEHWLAIAADMRKCKIYVFDSMPNYVEQLLMKLFKCLHDASPHSHL
ncbi:Ulp1-like peptidase [Cucumis melo var. makuwa]|uniref:Ulp1-like peptidase n=1 Tax=Cucumis melo var. makuwa TaxID=1194695 RepID=A0A5A7TJT7_CUCMM|nr:Ulp1-like peptidase [Cucumis melo var. makuwa]